MKVAATDPVMYYCSFCGKSQDEVLCLIAGPTVFICDECTALCSGISFDHCVIKIVREHLAASGIETEGQDAAEGLVAKHESPTGKAGDAQQDPYAIARQP